MKDMQEKIYLALLVAMALALSLVESAIPNPLIPGAKLGLSNIVTLTVIIVYGFKDGLIVTVLKSIMLVLVTGNVIAFIYSLPSGIMSSIVMNASYRYLNGEKEILSLAGISILGAITHNTTQVTVAMMVLENKRIYLYLPLMLIISIFTGYFVGISSSYISVKLKKILKKGRFQ